MLVKVLNCDLKLSCLVTSNVSIKTYHTNGFWTNAFCFISVSPEMHLCVQEKHHLYVKTFYFSSEEGAETYINFELAFHETITNETEAVARLLSVITEKAKRATLPDLTVAIVLGPFMVFQDSLQPSITNPEIFRTPSPTTGRKVCIVYKTQIDAQTLNIGK